MFFRLATKCGADAVLSLARSTCQSLTGQLRALFFFIIAFFATPALATNYSFSGSSFPACSSGGWSQSGATWTCSGSTSLNSGDTILPSSAITVLAQDGISLAGNNTIGSSTIAVNLSAGWNTITIGGSSTIFGNIYSPKAISLSSTTVNGNVTSDYGGITASSSTINGNLVSGSGALQLTNTLVNGSITLSGTLTISGGKVTGAVSANNGVTSTNGTVFSSSVSASNGKIDLSGGSVAGNLVSGCCTITANNVNIGGGISTTVISSSQNTITINGGTVAGAISSSGGSGIIITNATVTSGSITTSNVPITISGSTIGSATNQVNITSNHNVTLSNTTVYGNVTAGNWPNALTTDSSTIIYGLCTSDSNSVKKPQNYPQCTSAPPPVNISTFNACHNYASGACATTAARLYTQQTGTAFNTDIVALKSDGSVNTAFTGKVTVSVIERAKSDGALDANNCFTPDMERVLDGAATAFTAGRLTLGTTLSTAYPDVRFKIVCENTVCTPSGITTCSSDNFAVRPSAFSSVTTPVDANGNKANADTINGTLLDPKKPVVKAGAALTINVTAGDGYNGTPKIDQKKIVTAVSGHIPGTLGGVFNAATAADGIASSSQLTYSEVGYFSIDVNGIYDNAFTIVDQRSDGNDCIPGYSNTAVNGKIGCYFGNDQQTPYFGRFIPDHFELTPSAAVPACNPQKTTLNPAPYPFTYFGQDFTTPFKLTAKNAKKDTNGEYETTLNYIGSFALLPLYRQFALASKDNPGVGFSFSSTPTSLDKTESHDAPNVPMGSWDKGVADISATHYVKRPDIPTGETALTISALPVDADGVTLPAVAPATVPVAVSLLVSPQTSSTLLRYGRAQLINAYGSEVLPLPLTLKLQYWSGASGWQINAADTCTVIGASNFAFDFPAKPGNNLSVCKTAMTVSGSAPNYKVSLSAPGTGNDGWTTVALNLAPPTPSGTQCITAGTVGGTPTTVNAPWLQYHWISKVMENPQAQATFGKYRSGPVIFRRETY